MTDDAGPRRAHLPQDLLDLVLGAHKGGLPIELTGREYGSPDCLIGREIPAHRI